jgi:hypothetical protein
MARGMAGGSRGSSIPLATRLAARLARMERVDGLFDPRCDRVAEALDA